MFSRHCWSFFTYTYMTQFLQHVDKKFKMVLKKVDNRIRVLIENGVQKKQRSLFVVVGDKGKDQVSCEKLSRLLFFLSLFLFLSLCDSAVFQIMFTISNLSLSLDSSELFGFLDLF